VQEQHQPLSNDEAEAAKEAHQKIYKQNNKEDLESHGADAVGGAVVAEVGPSSLISLALSQARRTMGLNLLLGDAESHGQRRKH
jgi:hypothetical protein